jgi:hypothetical protein
MPSDARNAAVRLKRAARSLDPVTPPYYMHNPRPGLERFGPGWYWVPAGGDPAAPEYLATNSWDASRLLHDMAAGSVAA